MEKRLLLVDTTGLIFRAFYTVKGLTAPDGTPVNAVFGMVRILLKVFKDTVLRLRAVVRRRHGHLPQGACPRLQGQPRRPRGRPAPAVRAVGRGRRGHRRAGLLHPRL